MLDDDPDAEADSQIIPEDIPVLKSFVDDVPVLNESMDNDAEEEPPAADDDDDIFSLGRGLLKAMWRQKPLQNSLPSPAPFPSPSVSS